MLTIPYIEWFKEAQIEIYDNLYKDILNEKEKDEIIGNIVNWLDEKV